MGLAPDESVPLAKATDSLPSGGVFAVIPGLIGAGSLGNAFWMLTKPHMWYELIPAGLADYGPYNEHFVRDVGCAYTTAGLVLVWAAYSKRLRAPLVAAGALFYGLHALVHVFDTARQAVSSAHWLMDLPTTYVPALLLAVVAFKLLRAQTA